MTRRKPARPYGYAEIAAAIGVSAPTLRVWRNRGKMPSPDFQGGQSPLWLPTSIEPWIQEHLPAPVDEAAAPVA